MNGLITEGIPLGAPIQFLTSGLGLGQAPLSDPITSAKAGMLYLNVPKEILSDGVDDDISNPYPLPNGSTKISYQFAGTVSDVDLLGSLDGTHFVVIANKLAAGVYTIFTNVTFIAARVNTGSGVSVVVIAQREKL